MTQIKTKKGIEKDGKKLVRYEYDDIVPANIDGKASQDIYLTRNGDTKGIIKLKGKRSYRRRDGFATVFVAKDAIVASYDGKNQFLVDVGNLKTITRNTYEQIVPVGNRLFITRTSNGYGVINVHGEELVANAAKKIDYDTAAKSFVVKF